MRERSVVGHLGHTGSHPGDLCRWACAHDYPGKSDFRGMITSVLIERLTMTDMT